MILRFALRAATFAALILAPGAAALAQNQPVGERYLVRPDALPPPHATASVANPAERLRRPPDARPRVPPGFTAEIFAGGLSGPRSLLTLPNGDILVAESYAGDLVLLTSGGGGTAVTAHRFAEGLDRPFGLALHDGWIYVGEAGQVRRLRWQPGERRAASAPETVTPPGSLGRSTGNHWTRSLAFAPDGKHFFVGVGSRSNVAVEPAPHATIQQFAADGSGQRTYASGLRNPVGLAFQPGTGALWTSVAERDGLGDELVPDYATRVAAGGFYGWPYAYAGQHPDPDYGNRRPDMVARSLTPDVLIRAHSTPLGLLFYDGGMFPPDYRGDAFVSLHGSWNAASPRGYMVARVRFKDGKPVDGSYESFATGFWAKGRSPAEVWGRPVGLAVAADGALLVADDVANVIWRIAYKGGAGG